MTGNRPCAAVPMLFLALVLWNATSSADVRLPHIFGDHMVLQQGMAVPVWGWGDPGEEVSVQLGEQPAVTTTAGADGRWKLALPAQTAGGPTTLTVSGKNRIVLEDVLIGEVWLCSGQSNMQWTVAGCLNAAAEIAAADFPQIRQIAVPSVTAGYPTEDFNGEWRVCTPQTAGGFTAVGFFFARHIHQELGVPVGIINSSWGGTAIEPWTPPVGFQHVPALEGIYKQVDLTNPGSDAYKQTLSGYLQRMETWMAEARAALEAERPLSAPPEYPKGLLPLTGVGQPTAICNAMIMPLVPFAIRGALWYQGESNHGEGMLYTEKMKALIGGWRELWRQSDFPFYYVQIAPFRYGEEDPEVLPRFWEAQAAAQAIPNTGMVVINDIGDLDDIHPRNKQDVGKRLALWALAKTYGREGIVYSGPTFKSLEVEPGRLRVHFDNIGSGLASRDGQPLTWFEVVGEDTDFVPAEAVIEGDCVVLSSPQVKQPVAMRFAWHKTAQPNLMNKEGLPAGAFRAGEVPKRDWLALKVPEAKDYQLVYDLDLSKLGPNISYDVDNHEKIAGPIARIAYFLELQKPGESTRWVYVSMDAFTQDLSKIGVPTAASGANFQRPVSNMKVLSNVKGLPTGEGLQGGNIEFWPNNYGPNNVANVPNASSSVWDFGDGFGDPVDGYGCMQVHDHEAKQTLFAINNWKAGGDADIGIGNSDGETRDWTFKKNASQYAVKRLRVLVRTK